MPVKRSSEAEILSRLREAFLAGGYGALSMADLAEAAGLSRRALYYRFPSKEAAYRAMIRWQNEDSLRTGFEAGRRVRDAGGTPVDVVAAIVNARFGETRRMVESSAHSVELNAVAFATCRDIAIDVAVRFQNELADLLASLVREGAMSLRPGFSTLEIAELMAHGARGVNYALPPVPVAAFADQYRRMCEAVLFGAAIVGRPPARRRGRAGEGD